MAKVSKAGDVSKESCGWFWCDKGGDEKNARWVGPYASEHDATLAAEGSLCVCVDTMDPDMADTEEVLTALPSLFSVQVVARMGALLAQQPELWQDVLFGYHNSREAIWSEYMEHTPVAGGPMGTDRYLSTLLQALADNRGWGEFACAMLGWVCHKTNRDSLTNVQVYNARVAVSNAFARVNGFDS